VKSDREFSEVVENTTLKKISRKLGAGGQDRRVQRIGRSSNALAACLSGWRGLPKGKNECGLRRLLQPKVPQDLKCSCRGVFNELIVGEPSKWHSTRRIVTSSLKSSSQKSAADFPAQGNCPDGKGQYVKVDKRNRDDAMVCIGDRSDRP
jgi:hypothetical protein